MKKDDIIRMAREAGYGDAMADLHSTALERFANIVAAAEREACAKMCDSLSKDRGIILDEMLKNGVIACAEMCAAVIRARGESEDS